MNPFSFGVFFPPATGVKYLERVCVVSPFIGMGGKLGLCGWFGFCADTLLTHECNANKTTRVLAGNKDVNFLFIVDFFLCAMLLTILHDLSCPYKWLTKPSIFVRILYTLL